MLGDFYTKPIQGSIRSSGTVFGITEAVPYGSTKTKTKMILVLVVFFLPYGSTKTKTKINFLYRIFVLEWVWELFFKSRIVFFKIAHGFFKNHCIYLSTFIFVGFQFPTKMESIFVGIENPRKWNWRTLKLGRFSLVVHFRFRFRWTIRESLRGRKGTIRYVRTLRVLERETTS